MTSLEEEVARQFAVLDALTENVDRSTATPLVDTRRLPDTAGYRYKQDASWSDEKKYKDGSLQLGSDNEDNDWRDIRACGDDPDLPSDPFVHFYDSETGAMYYIERQGGKNTSHEAASTQDVSSSVVALSSGAQDSTSSKPETNEILSRLRNMDGQYGPRGYHAWLSKLLQNQDGLDSNIPGTSSLCGACHTMLTRSLLMFKWRSNPASSRKDPMYETHHFHEVFIHHGTMEGLVASVYAGCHFCSLILGSNIRKKVQGNNPTYFLHLGRMHLQARFRNPTFASQILFNRKERQIGNMSTLRNATTDAPEVCDLARSWLHRCVESHRETCSIATEFLPSRLIKIDVENGKLHCARLVLRSDLPSDTRYLTLSHCWGKSRPLSLTQETFDSFRKDIPISILSKTYQETLQVTAWLGYEHVWIDSLCILQDSDQDQDWLDEAARMGDIYRHSTCTIAAAGAKDGDDGLFAARNSLAFTACPLFVRRGRHIIARNSSRWPTPLSDRAWAVQERHLSSRMLSFGSDKISWTCRRIKACEGPRAYDIGMRAHPFPRLLDINTDENIANAAWREIVRDYSACELTFWKDKWPAFQGLTAEVEKAQGWIIAHGLRSHLLSTDLLWYAANSEPGRKTIDCGEPSWSWLNVQGGVGWNFNYLCSDAKINLQELSTPADVTQTPAGHTIQINAFMADLAADSSTSTKRPNCTLTVRNPRYRIATSGEPVPEVERLLRGFWYPDTNPSHHNGLRALQICSQWGRCAGELIHRMRGLVITAVLDRPGYWRRVGYYTAIGHPDLPEQALTSEDLDQRAYTSVATLAWCVQADFSGSLRETDPRGSGTSWPALPMEPREDNRFADLTYQMAQGRINRLRNLRFLTPQLCGKKGTLGQLLCLPIFAFRLSSQLPQSDSFHSIATSIHRLSLAIQE
jgi:hypothetical protein